MEKSRKAYFPFCRSGKKDKKKITELQIKQQQGRGEFVELKNKVAIITGASSGIGQAVARNLDQSGVRFVLTGRRKERLAALADELTDAVCLAGDIVEPELPGRLIDTAVAHFGRCDIVFNNAGVMALGTIEDVDVDQICRMVRVNVEAAFRMAYTALKHFMSAGSGYLVNTSSIAGNKVRPNLGAYCGTKHAIEALTESLRMELARTGIGIACIEPGLVETELFRDWAREPPAKMFDIPTPLRPDDIARLVRFILEQPDHVRIPRILAISADQSL
ncbi:MAG: SDR family NAD(P)-dependent oxidoreductase [Deltaproteobacteria bacterium]|nr:MAG: SDR family NAD(P)-dependent oxidoreductase [Deltaproteobacteria bacterium]